VLEAYKAKITSGNKEKMIEAAKYKLGCRTYNIYTMTFWPLVERDCEKFELLENIE